MRIEPSLQPLSPENGNISNISRRLSAISGPQRQFRSPETDGQFAKARRWRAFLRLPRVKSSGARLPGWGGRIRTSAWWNQNPLPYHLATPQQTVWKAAGPPLSPRIPFRQRRSIEGGEPFQPAGGEISPGIKSPISRPDLRPLPFDRSFASAHAASASLGAKLMASRAISPTGELREPRFRGKTAASSLSPCETPP